MRIRPLLCTAVLAVTLALSGCVFGNVDEMYALPRSSEAYVALQRLINAEKGAAEFIAPLQGDNRQTIQLVDIDGDGTQEAVAFFRDASAPEPLTIVLFKQDETGEYHVYARIQGQGSEIGSIEYTDLGGGCDLLVSWQAGSSVHTLVGYTIANGQPLEIMRSGFSRYLTADLDADGCDEVLLAQSESAHWRIEYYDARDGVMEMVSSAPLSEGATDISTWSAGTLEGDAPALFVASYSGRDVLIADILCLDGGGSLRNISLDPETGRSPNTFPHYAVLGPADITGDGCIEVPRAVAVPGFGDSAGSTFWWIEWRHYRADGTDTKVRTTCHGADGGWYLDIPESWTGPFSMARKENAAAGIYSLTFARGVETAATDASPGTEAAPFLTICRLVGADRAETAREGDRFLLCSNSTALYTGEFLDGWDCGLTESELVQRFHPNEAGWTS